MVHVELKAISLKIQQNFLKVMVSYDFGGAAIDLSTQSKFKISKSEWRPLE